MGKSSSFKKGDIVQPLPGIYYNECTFEIIGETSDYRYMCWSEKLHEEDRGHDGGIHINGKSKGHFNYRPSELRLVSEAFKVGDFVKPKSGRKWWEYTFQILEIDGFVRCYSKELDDADKGHEGGSHINGKHHGHWNYGDYDLELVSKEEFSFKIGDIVKAVKGSHKGFEFEVLHVSEDNVTGFSQKLHDDDKGHSGGGKGNGKMSGHWHFDYNEIELIKSKQIQHKQHEVSRSDSDSPRGVTTRIYSSKCTLASGGRFVGTPATNFKLKGRLAKGTVKHNVQSHGLC